MRGLQFRYQSGPRPFAAGASGWAVSYYLCTVKTLPLYADVQVSVNDAPSDSNRKDEIHVLDKKENRNKR